MMDARSRARREQERPLVRLSSLRRSLAVNAIVTATLTLPGYPDFYNIQTVRWTTLVMPIIKEAVDQEVLITRHGRRAGILIGFADEADYFDYKLESDPRFEARNSRSREQKQQGDVIRLEDIEP